MQQPTIPNPYEGLPPSDRQRWVCVYPAYINAKKTVKQGRRIPKPRAVNNPTCQEIRDVCISQGLNCEVEAKQFSRELARDHIHSGRVRVQLKIHDGSPLNPTITNKRQLFLQLVELIPKLKTRQTGVGKTSAPGAEAGGGGAQAGGGGGGRKKKGKRK